MRVGTKTLKNRLSHYLRRVRAGETVTVTDRGVPVAELRSVVPAASREAEALQRLVEDGVLTLGSGRYRFGVPVRLRRQARLSNVVLEDRG